MPTTNHFDMHTLIYAYAQQLFIFYSHQPEYDFGLNAMMCLLSILNKSLPKYADLNLLPQMILEFLSTRVASKDQNLVRGIVKDVFPETEFDIDCLNNNKDSGLRIAIERHLRQCDFHFNDRQLEQAIQLHEAMSNRSATILVGKTGCGKSTILSTLLHVSNRLQAETDGASKRQIEIKYLNPGVNPKQVFGGDWMKPGLWSTGILRSSLHDKLIGSQKVLWIVFDGPMATTWTENLNTALDSCAMICFQNSERILIDDSVKCIFEIDDLSYASPYAISRCSLVWIDPWDSNWMLQIRWKILGMDKGMLCEYLKTFLLELIENHLERCLLNAENHFACSVVQPRGTRISLFCAILKSLLFDFKNKELVELDRSRSESVLLKLFVWCLFWSFGSHLIDQTKYEQFIRATFQHDPQSE